MSQSHEDCVAILLVKPVSVGRDLVFDGRCGLAGNVAPEIVVKESHFCRTMGLVVCVVAEW